MELTPKAPTPAVVHVSLDETLRRMKADLRREFPRVKFSVRRSRGTGYGFVYVGWTDGPRAADVRDVVAQYEGEGFDGMTDSSFPIEHVDADEHGAPRVVRYGTRGISCSRTHSAGRLAISARLLLLRCPDPKLSDDRRAELRNLDDVSLAKELNRVRLWDDYLATLVYRALEAEAGSTLSNLLNPS
jgi:hypothetical protein